MWYTSQLFTALARRPMRECEKRPVVSYRIEEIFRRTARCGGRWGVHGEWLPFGHVVLRLSIISGGGGCGLPSGICAADEGSTASSARHVLPERCSGRMICMEQACLLYGLRFLGDGGVRRLADVHQGLDKVFDHLAWGGDGWAVLHLYYRSIGWMDRLLSRG